LGEALIKALEEHVATLKEQLAAAEHALKAQSADLQAHIATLNDELAASEA
jgi:hypothetical protein